jgi:hypothetical protein
MTDAKEKTVAPEESAGFMEYLGDEVHGTNFLSSHTIPKGDHLWKRAGVDAPKKDLVWERDPYGPAIGQKGNRLLIPLTDLTEDQAKALERVPGFKRVAE